MSTSPTIVLVHGAFADASSWNGVIPLLEQRGYTVVAPPNPLRGIAFDAAYMTSFVNQIEGPVLLVGHSYGGAVITNTGSNTPNAVGLVYVAGFAPDAGETLADVEKDSKDSVLNSALVARQYPSGPNGETSLEFFIDRAQVREAFAGDLSDEQIDLIGATQRPIGAAAFTDTTVQPAWKTLRTWAVVATGDKTIGSDVVRSMAKRAGAAITEIEGSHVIMVSQPNAVCEVIVQAAKAVAAA